MRKAAFLDRDGTLIVDKGYLCDPDGVELLPGVPEALCLLRDAGYDLVIVTNQSAIARGLCTTEQVDAVNARVRELLAVHGVAFLDTMVCPHMPDGGCACRKPRPGMLVVAAERHCIDLALSLMFGDKAIDVEAGIAAGCAISSLVGLPGAASLSDSVRSILGQASEGCR